MSFLYTWIIIGVIFLFIEVFTVTLYGLSLAIAAFVVAGYVALTNETDFTLIQALLFFLVGAVLVYILPKYFMNRVKTKSQGFDTYIGNTGKIVNSTHGVKVELDGVPYPIEGEDEKTFHAGDTVIILSHKAGVFNVEKKK